MSLKVGQKLVVEGNTLFWTELLPRLAGKKQTVVIYICLPHFQETFLFYKESTLFFSAIFSNPTEHICFLVFDDEGVSFLQ